MDLNATALRASDFPKLRLRMYTTGSPGEGAPHDGDQDHGSSA